MKKRYQYVIFNVLLIASFINAGEAYAQAKLLVNAIDIHVPIMVHTDRFSDVPGNEYNFSGDSKMDLALNLSNYLEKYSRSGDTVSLLYGESTFSPFRETTIHFIFDSLHSKLRDFYIAYADNIYYADHKISVQYDSIDCAILGDSVIVVNDSGAVCRKNFHAANYTYHYYSSRGQSNHVSDDETMDSVILEDTMSFKCSLAFSMIKPINAAQISNAKVNSINATIALPDHSIHFHFAPVAYQRQLFIYDLLGREVVKIEIAPEISYVVRASTDFPRGVYFVRLGNQLVHFEVR